MNALPYLKEIFDRLKRGTHLSPEDEPWFSALTQRHEEYAAYFDPLGMKLVRHEREFFYFEPEHGDKVPDTLPKIAVFSYILVDFAANQGRSIEEFIMGQSFLVSKLPHFTLDRYSGLLRQVDVVEPSDLLNVLANMERIGWLHRAGPDEFRFLRPFHRVFSKCIEVSQKNSEVSTASTSPIPEPLV
jgi:hypothetical protein